MVDQEEIHRMAQSDNSEERGEAVNQIHLNFASLFDKKQAWEDIILLMHDKDVHWDALIALVSMFPHILNKKEAYEDIHLLMQDEDEEVRIVATNSLLDIFPHIVDKKKAWEDLHELTQDENSFVRMEAALSLCSAFSYIPEKEVAWNDLLRLARDKEVHVQLNTIESLGDVFLYLPDKKQAWNELHRFTKDKDKTVRRIAYSLGVAFPHIPDKKKAWDDLHRLTKDKDIHVRWGAAKAIGAAFSNLPDKKHAWDDLHRLILDKNNLVRSGATESLGVAFSMIPDTKKAWNILHKLTQDKDKDVRRYAAESLGAAFSNIPDKKQAWDDLHSLIRDEDSYVRMGATYSLGSALINIPDKEQVWHDLHRLLQDEDTIVLIAANYSLGRACILKAIETKKEEDFKKELENALDFFEKSSNEAGYIFISPVSFCLPFYRSFYTMIFKKHEAESEIQNYLNEAKISVSGSKNKEYLLEAVETLANALREVQNARVINFNTMKCDLNVYRRYCEHASDLLKNTEERTPTATKLIRRGLPIIDQKIKEMIAEVKEKAELACQQSKGTPTEEIVCAANKEIQKWRIGDQEQMAQRVDNLIFSLKSKIAITPENKHIHDKIEEIRKERDMTKQYEMLAILIALIPTASVHMGDNITVKGIATSGENIQVVVKGHENKNIGKNVSTFGNEPKKSWIERINSPATIAAFIFGLTVEIVTYIYPITYNHIISVGIAIIVFTIATILNKD